MWFKWLLVSLWIFVIITAPTSIGPRDDWTPRMAQLSVIAALLLIAGTLYYWR